MFNRPVIRSVAIACILCNGYPVLSRARGMGFQVNPEPMGLENAAQLARRSVVRIIAVGSNGNPVADGVGFFVRKDTIATTYGVIKDGLSFKVQLNGQTTAAAVLAGVDQSRRVALLVTERAEGTPLLVRYEHGSEATGEAYLVVRADGQGANCHLDSDGSVKIAGALEGPYGGSPILNRWGETIGLGEISGKEGQGHFIPISALSDVGGIIIAGSKTDVEREVDARKALAKGSPLPGPTQTTDANGSGMPIGTVRIKSIGGVPGAASEHPEMLQSPSIIRKIESALRRSILRQAVPLYPSRAKAANIAGRVIVEVTIDRRGYVTRALALSGPPALRGPAAAAAMAHLFATEILDGTPVDVVGRLTFIFQERSSAKPSAAGSDGSG